MVIDGYLCTPPGMFLPGIFSFTLYFDNKALEQLENYKESQKLLSFKLHSVFPRKIYHPVKFLPGMRFG